MKTLPADAKPAHSPWRRGRCRQRSPVLACQSNCGQAGTRMAVTFQPQAGRRGATGRSGSSRAGDTGRADRCGRAGREAAERTGRAGRAEGRLARATGGTADRGSAVQRTLAQPRSKARRCLYLRQACTQPTSAIPRGQRRRRRCARRAGNGPCAVGTYSQSIAFRRYAQRAASLTDTYEVMSGRK